MQKLRFMIIFNIACISLGQPAQRVRSCVLNSDGNEGSCVPLTECPELWHSVKRRNETAVLCGIDKRVPLVCCGSKTNKVQSQAAVALSYDFNDIVSSNKDISISQQKCQEYAKLVFKGEESKTELCSIRADSRKVGFATYGEFPHMASLVYEENDNLTEHACGGSLVSERFVLTAAHCLYPRGKWLKWVLLGAVDLGNTSTGQLIPIAQKIAHPDYYYPRKYFDIGLIHLKRTPDLGPLLRPACLPSDDENFSSRRLIVTGWGAIGYQARRSKDLLKTEIIQAPYHECANAYGTILRPLRFGIHNASMFCAGKPTGSGSGACQGDSGGPIQAISTKHHCMYEIAGVTSFGRGCGLQGYPDVFGRVQYYRRWIENIIWP